MITVADYVPDITTYLWRRQNRADPVTSKAPISLRVEIPGFPRAEISTSIQATGAEWNQDFQQLQEPASLSKEEEQVLAEVNALLKPLLKGKYVSWSWAKLCFLHGEQNAEVNNPLFAAPHALLRSLGQRFKWNQHAFIFEPLQPLTKQDKAYQREQMDRITDLRRKVERVYHGIKAQGTSPSPKQLREMVRPKSPVKTVDRSFACILETYRKDVASPARKRKPATIRNNIQYTLWLLMYMYHTRQLEILADDIDRVWLREFENWAEARGLGGATLRPIIGVAQSALEMAEAEGVIKQNRTVGYRYKSKRTKPKKRRLTKEDVEAIAAFQFTDLLQPIADMFLFMCYTGLSRVDYIRFAEAPEKFLRHQINPVTGRPALGIEMARQKMEGQQDETWAPLFPKARALLIDKYQHQLPIYSKSYANVCLKQIAKDAGLTLTKISNKDARSTFSQLMRDEYGGEIAAALARHNQATMNTNYSSVSPKQIMSVLGMDLTDN